MFAVMAIAAGAVLHYLYNGHMQTARRDELGDGVEKVQSTWCSKTIVPLTATGRWFSTCEIPMATWTFRCLPLAARNYHKRGETNAQV